MTTIEELVREALQTVPAVEPGRDPLAALDRRVRRARRRLAMAGSVVAAAATAAVVVPLATLGGGGEQASVVPLDPVPSPTASPSPSLAPTDEWLPFGAHGVAFGRGSVWVVTSNNEDRRGVAALDGDGHALMSVALASPADFAAVGDDAVWVWGGGDGGYPDGLVQRVGIPDHSVASLPLPATTPIQIAPMGADAWVVVPDAVLQLRMIGDRLTQVSRIDLAGARRIVATPAGHLWVEGDGRLVELEPTGDTGARIAANEHWSGPLLAASAGDMVWTTDVASRAVELDPVALEQGASVAMGGKRLLAHGRVGWPLATNAAGGVYLLAGNDEVDYFAPANATGPADDRLRGVEVETMAVTPGGGVALSTFDGTLLHWDPTAAGR